MGKIVEDEVRVDPKDPFLVRKPTGKSRLKDLSRRHDEYLYGEANSQIETRRRSV